MTPSHTPNHGSRKREPAVPFQPVVDPAGWTAESQLESGEYLYHLSDQHVADLDEGVRRLDNADLSLMDVTRRDFPLPTLGPELARLRSEILNGRDFVQIRGFPVERYTQKQAAIAFWGLSMHLGDRVASQNAKGHVLGHITDIGETVHNPNQRGPYSSDTIPYHVDCCDIVGLMCLQPARSGGESSVASSITVHNELLRRRPDVVRVLARPYYRDRRGEIPPGMPPWYRLAVFNYHKGFLSTNIEPTYMGSAHRHAGVPEMTPEQREALDLARQVAAELHLDIAFERGDMQFLNNHVIMHSRQAFEDDPDPQRRRHLLRIWLLNKGCRPLPELYFARHGEPDRVDWPGGIVGPDTVLNAPIGID